ncbi:alpha-glucosidase 2 [Fusarium pseudocircinatum]|uniref:Alpha-glucosidase 2 n=1 Tax=Fusarium pseudocircinatum TaxID=56676 RepID=A0A8H5KPK3_9HYPO|nr:alpha-glucosidase 2 [Fusarium pseudocircinatum]
MATPTDPLNFIPADIFFPTVSNFTKPSEALTVESTTSTSPSDPLRYAAHITLKGEPNTHCLVQFASPQIWRVRYNPKYTAISDYDDYNSRTIVRDTFSSLVDDLQQEYRDSEAWNSYPAQEGWFWKTTFEQKSSDHWILTTVEYETKESTGVPNTALHFFASPFRIVATRKLKPLDADPAFLKTVGIDTVSEYEEIIWQTKEETFSYQGNPSIGAVNNVVLNIKKPGPAAYLGFGEQGGRTVIKKPTYLNFFCYDNFNYSKVYGLGALDTREPLYHSTPFFLEMNGTPDRKNVTGVMVDNYSQVAIDLGKNDSHTISIATRFNTFDAWILTADDVPRMIWQYTSIVGRPKLKPRFILGHHQACYGYSNESTCQDKYRTFTSSNYGFPNVGSFLNGLKAKGVKSCTNITPILTIRPSDQGPYTALDSFWDVNDKKNPETNLLVADKRYLDGLPNNQPLCWRYDGGLQNLDPNNVNQREKFADYIGAPDYRDDYNFSENYNSGYPFHGGVSYGTNLGTPGFYPDLNRKAARKKWGEQYQYLFDNGLEFVWQDMTTPAAAKCYGDSLGFPSRLLMTDDSYTNPPKTKTAIELWSLYSYNLHKATYHGLNNLKGRENKRNFIIGRGSQTGMHRYAGLWTGDNGSSWDFFRISVAQVLALGYSGLSIAGVDMGGFTADPANTLPNPRWCDPELLIRCIRRLVREVEPWAYDDILHNFPGPLPPDQAALYRSVVPVCRYYVQLRYSLLQVLYDYMFANLINGLPVARAMLVTDPFDTSLFNSNQGFIDNQYLLGHNILVCPQVEEKARRRDVYLPNSDKWYPSNLRVNNQGFGPDPILKHAAVLQKPAPGGKIVDYDCHIPDAVADPEQVAYVTPVYIRGGAIIPQLDVRQWVKEGDLNPPTIHVYPGGKTTEPTSYSMYLDDGVSRDSAPIELPQHKYKDAAKYTKAKGIYREVKITQENSKTNRKITIRHQWDGYDAKATVGDTYNFAIWTVQATAPPESQISVEFEDENGMTVIDSGLTSTYIAGRGVLTLEEFYGQPPEYAILSHTWGPDEATYQDWQGNLELMKLKKGHQKIRRVCEQARKDGLMYLWCDTNCIDKSSSSEVSEALNAMFSWYKNASVCYVYLSDVAPIDTGAFDPMVQFRQSRWFTRGWTLPELLAPTSVVFFANDWTTIGTRKTLANTISFVTKIDQQYLDCTFYKASIGERMSWLSKRETERVEDIAYCMLGIFDINMQIIYGEGMRAFIRLQEEIIRASNDQTLFCWAWDERYVPHDWASILSPSPKTFVDSSIYTEWPVHEAKTYTMTNAGLSIRLPIMNTITESVEQWLVLLNARRDSENQQVALLLNRLPGKDRCTRNRTPPCPVPVLTGSTKLREENMFIAGSRERAPYQPDFHGYGSYEVLVTLDSGTIPYDSITSCPRLESGTISLQSWDQAGHYGRVLAIQGMQSIKKNEKRASVFIATLVFGIEVIGSKIEWFCKIRGIQESSSAFSNSTLEEAVYEEEQDIRSQLARTGHWRAIFDQEKDTTSDTVRKHEIDLLTSVSLSSGVRISASSMMAVAHLQLAHIVKPAEVAPWDDGHKFRTADGAKDLSRWLSALE